MPQRHFHRSLGAFIMLAPLLVSAQRGGGGGGGGGGHRGGPVGTIVGPRPAPGTMVGFGTLRHDRFERRGFDDRSRFDHGVPFNRFGPRVFGSPFFFGPTVEVIRTQVATPVPYYVPYYYYPAPMRARSLEDSVPPAPYDPTKSRTVWVGEGLDGGGGVMRIEQLSDSQLRLTWRGSLRPVRRAQLFLADSLRQSIRTQSVDVITPAALFHIADLERRIAYTGLTIEYADGATETWLVPFDAERR